MVNRTRIAVIGGGIAGLGAAWALSRRYPVTLFEAANYLGGHANTRDITLDGSQVAVDTGFIVYNEHNYPQLTRLFRHLEVPTQASDMSFAVSLGDGRIEYEGSRRGLLAQPGNLLRPSFLRMLRDLLRFYRSAPEILGSDKDRDLSLGEMLDRGGYSKAFVEQHILPMGAAIWSANLDDMRAFPAQSFVSFFVNHRLFDLDRRPAWRTVAGGSREYVRRLRDDAAGQLHCKAEVTAIRRTPAGVLVKTAQSDWQAFDQIVLAVHADQALRLLGAGASESERAVLGAFSYATNRAVLHSDPRLMPRRRRAWASWNYLAAGNDGSGSAPVSVSYWMNRLQSLPTAKPVIVTLNPLREPEEALTFGTFDYDHPQFNAAALAAQRRLPLIQGARRTWFCGSYCGHGFHEDALQSGLSVAEALGAATPWAGEVQPASPAAGIVQPLEPLAAAE